MLRTVAAHCATLQAHLNKYPTQTIIDNQTMADTGVPRDGAGGLLVR